MELKDKIKLVLLPMLLSAGLLTLFFVGGLRIGASIQRQIDQPALEECVNELIGQLETNELDAGTP